MLEKCQKKVLKPLQERVLSLTKPFLWIGGASNEKWQSKPHSLKNKSPQNLEEQKYKQEKLNQNKMQYMTKLEKNMN